MYRIDEAVWVFTFCLTCIFNCINDYCDAVLIKLLEISVIVSLRCIKSLLLLQIPVFFFERVRRGEFILLLLLLYLFQLEEKDM